jgi:hypothetical protein
VSSLVYLTVVGTTKECQTYGVVHLERCGSFVSSSGHDGAEGEGSLEVGLRGRLSFELGGRLSWVCSGC